MKQEVMESAMAQIAQYLPTGIADNFDCQSRCQTKEGKIHSLLCSMGTIVLNDGESVTSTGKNREKLTVSVYHDDTKYQMIGVCYTNQAGYTIEIETPFLG